MNDAPSLYLQGLKRHRARDYAGAVQLLEEATRLDPSHADSWEALGVLYDKIDRLDDAIRATEELARLRPDEVMAHTNLSRFYMKKGWTERAEEEQSRARVLGWRQELAGGGGNQDLAQVPTQAAAPDLVQMVEGAPTTPPPGADPELLQRKIDQFEALLERNPDDVLARLTLGRTYLEAGRAGDAVRALNRLIEQREDYSVAYVALGRALEASGQLARALRVYRKGIEVAERQGDRQPLGEMEARLATLTRPAD